MSKVQFEEDLEYVSKWRDKKEYRKRSHIVEKIMEITGIKNIAVINTLVLFFTIVSLVVSFLILNQSKSEKEHPSEVPILPGETIGIPYEKIRR